MADDELDMECPLTPLEEARMEVTEWAEEQVAATMNADPSFRLNREFARDLAHRAVEKFEQMCGKPELNIAVTGEMKETMLCMVIFEITKKAR